MRNKVHIIGIDCAVQDNRVGLACGSLEEGKLEILSAMPGRSGALRRLMEWIDPAIPTLLTIDAPLGWPVEMGKTLGDHRAGKPIAVEANLLFRRLTDREIKSRLGQQPLDVGADRIARTGHRALQLLIGLADELGIGEVPLAWNADLRGDIWAIEVYPAATLTAWNIPIKGYKNQEQGAEKRREILRRLRDHLSLPANLDDKLVGCVDALDAVVCVLAGMDFLLGRAVAPSEEQVESARKEGWIWCRERARTS